MTLNKFDFAIDPCAPKMALPLNETIEKAGHKEVSRSRRLILRFNIFFHLGISWPWNQLIHDEICAEVTKPQVLNQIKRSKI